MWPAQRKECTFSGSNLEYLITYINVETPIKDIHEFMFTGVNMRRWLGTAPHMREHQIEGASRVVASRQQGTQNALVPL
jgi:hypothetical protein